MPTILAIETSSEIASVAILHGTRLIFRQSCGVQTHSQTVLPMVQNVLEEAGISLSQCTAIAFGQGPGSFTGVRTACGIAQGLAFGADLPVIPVVTLLAAAQAGLEANDNYDVLVMLDARMNEVYWAQYQFQNVIDGWKIISPPALTPASAVRADGAPLMCGNGLSAYPDSLDSSLINLAARPELMPHATQIATLGRAAYLRGERFGAEQAQPFYLRNKIAFTIAERALKATKAVP